MARTPCFLLLYNYTGLKQRFQSGVQILSFLLLYNYTGLKHEKQRV